MLGDNLHQGNMSVLNAERKNIGCVRKKKSNCYAQNLKSHKNCIPSKEIFQFLTTF